MINLYAFVMTKGSGPLQPWGATHAALILFEADLRRDSGHSISHPNTGPFKEGP